jgi:hypothetical protein
MMSTLKFRVAAHIVEDLGLNLYTDLPRVLVEYVANAHDADSPHVGRKDQPRRDPGRSWSLEA